MEETSLFRHIARDRNQDKDHTAVSFAWISVRLLRNLPMHLRDGRYHPDLRRWNLPLRCTTCQSGLA